MADPIGRARASFATAFGRTADLTAYAPGRVNLIGEHTDYNDGFVLPCAIGVGTAVAIRRRADDAVHVVAADFGDARDQFALDSIEAIGGWADYVRGMVLTMRNAGHELPGADIAVAGSVPQGAGLSSSASLEVAVGQAFAALAGLALDPTQLALLAQAAESDFVGCKCGIMDQLVSARGMAGHALLIDCRSLETQAVPVPQDIAIVIAHSGVTRGLVDGHYNERRAQCEAAARYYGVAALRDLDVATLAANRGSLDDLIYTRARHVVTENARTLATGDALAAGDLQALGTLMAASHASMRDDFQITVPVIDRLTAIMQDAAGGKGGARMTGGGFGGAVVGLVDLAVLDDVKAAIARDYRAPDGAPAIVMVERPAAGAALV
jgi:galactokinase